MTTNAQDVNKDATSTSTTEVNGTDSSTVQNDSAQATDVKQPSETSTDNADSSAAKTPLDIVRAAVQPKEEKEPDASASDQGSQAPKADDGKLPAMTPEEEAKLPFHKHPRWKERQAELVSLRGRVQELEEPARQFGMVQEYMTKNNLTPQAVAEGLSIMALMQNDMKAALPIMRQYVERAELFLGERLPEDIQKKVDDGTITEDSGKELARARIESATARHQLETTTQQRAQETQLRTQQSVEGAVNAWEQTARANDPDFGLKQEYIRNAIVGMRAGKTITSPAEAVAIAQTAYKQANEFFGKVAPKRPQTPTHSTPRSGDSGRGGGGPGAAPKTPLDAVKQALGG